MKKRITQSARNMIILSFFLTISLITMITIFASKQNLTIENVIKSPQMLIALTIGCFGIILFLFTLYKALKRDENIEKLNNEYEMTFTQIKEYIGLSRLTFIEKKELINEILSMFLEAQSKGKSVNEVIGNNHQAFIDNMIKAHGVQNSLFYDLLTGAQFFIFYIIAIHIFIFAERDSINFFMVEIDNSLILFFFINAFILLPLVYRIKRNKKINQEGKYFNNSAYLILATVGIVGSFIILMKIARLYFSHLNWVSVLINEGTIIISDPYVLIILLYLLFVIYILKRKSRIWNT